MFHSRLAPRYLLGLIFAAWITACAGPEAFDDGGTDGSAAPARDGGATTDAGTPFDAGPASGPDAGVDAGADAGVDAGVDAGTDAGVDAGPHSGLDGGSDAGRPSDAGFRRPVTICLTGACSDLSANCGSNYDFTQLCDELGVRDAGLVHSASGSTFATALDTNAQRVVAPLFTALDRNGDNAVDDLDGPIELNIIGFSWGGVNAGDLASRVVTDARITQRVLFRRVIIIDGFQPTWTPNPSIPIATPVDEAWSFRHSMAPSSDCSNGAPLGPYTGRRLGCLATQKCSDYDFSLAPTQTFNGLLGQGIGHCDVPRAASPYVLDLVALGRVTTALPPAVPVTP